MYNILFHVSGIAILEICFYFYYIGPMETKIFEKVVNKLAIEMVAVVDKNIGSMELAVRENINTLMPTSPPFSLDNNIINIPLSSSSIPLSPRMLQDKSVYDLATTNENIVQNIFPGLMTSNSNNTAANDAYMENLKNNAQVKRYEKRCNTENSYRQQISYRWF